MQWTEKYRPKDLNSIFNQDILIKICKNKEFIQNMPHLLFYGNAGIGKTTTALSLCKTIYGSDIIKERVLETNASQERGIQVVRDIITMFAKNSINKSKYDNFINPDYKIIILDECDAMTIDAQYALRRIIEIYSKTTRFILICNFIDKIIEPIQSRCALYKFKSFTNENIKLVLDNIIIKENLKISKNIMNHICNKSYGDMRKAINMLYMMRNINDISVLKYEDIINNSLSPLEIAQDLIADNWDIEDIFDIFITFALKKNNIDLIKKIYQGYNNIKNKNSVLIELINILSFIKN